MKEIKLNIHIDKPIEECFRYTLNSENTPKYFTSMKKEVASEFPVKLGTILRNTSDEVNWDEYEVIEFEDNRTFTLISKDSTYHVRYTFTAKENGTDFEYYEWVVEGELSSPTTMETLELLKSNLEKKKRSNLDVWAIQYDPIALLTALSNIKDKNANTIIFTNVLSEFQIGETKIVTRQFDTFLYSEENDLLVMLMRNGIATAKDIAEYLNKNGINYSIVTAMPNIGEYEDGYRIPEIWIARENYVVADALDESISKKVKECDYYPNLTGQLNLNMLSNATGAPLTVDGRDFKGLLQLQDKIVLLVNHEDQRTCNPKDIVAMLSEKGISSNIIECGEPQVIREEKGISR